MATKAEEKGWNVKVISGDKDLLQLVSDSTTVALTRKGITEMDTYDPAFLKEKYEINPEQVIDMKSFIGQYSRGAWCWRKNSD